jgi:hypothetical protein
LNITIVKAEERFDNTAFSTELVDGMASPLHTVYVCPQCEEKITFQKRNFECLQSKTHRSNLSVEAATCFDAYAKENLNRESPFLDWICPGCGTAVRVYVEFWAGGRHGDSGINLRAVIEAMPEKLLFCSEGRNALSGMTVNERLYTTGLLPAWDAAIQKGDRKAIIEVLNKIDLADQSTLIADTVLKPQR